MTSAVRVARYRYRELYFVSTNMDPSLQSVGATTSSSLAAPYHPHSRASPCSRKTSAPLLQVRVPVVRKVEELLGSTYLVPKSIRGASVRVTGHHSRLKSSILRFRKGSNRFIFHSSFFLSAHHITIVLLSQLCFHSICRDRPLTIHVRFTPAKSSDEPLPLPSKPLNCVRPHLTTYW